MRTLEQLGISKTPWKIGNNGVPYVVMDADGEIIASIRATEKMNANASFIEAAPMLCRALRKLLRFLEGDDSESSSLNELIADGKCALAAAGGESEVAK